jgi:hypothetical protein
LTILLRLLISPPRHKVAFKQPLVFPGDIPPNRPRSYFWAPP